MKHEAPKMLPFTTKLFFMEKRILGRTGLEVSVLGMGGLFVSTVGGRNHADGRNAVRRALELGVNYVDTAPNYADSEEVVGEALDCVLQPFGREYRGLGRAR